MRLKARRTRGESSSSTDMTRRAVDARRWSGKGMLIVLQRYEFELRFAVVCGTACEHTRLTSCTGKHPLLRRCCGPPLFALTAVITLALGVFEMVTLCSEHKL